MTAIVVAAVVGAGCASGQLAKVGPSAELPSELPPELREKYEIKDISDSDSESPPDGASQAAPPVVESSGSSAPRPREEASKEASAPTVVKADGTKKNKARSASKEKKEKEPFVYPSRRPEVDPLKLGESLVFEVNYFGLVAGDFTLSVKPYKVINSRKVYHIHGHAVSSKLFSMVYRLNDTVESFFDYDGLFSHRFHLVLDESKQTRDSLEIFDSEKPETFYWNRWNHKTKGYIETKEFKKIKRFPQDSLSALYYLRMAKLPPEGEALKFPVVSEGKTFEAVVWVVRREYMNTPMGRRKCVVLKPQAKYDGHLKQQGDTFLWLTDDENRYPVRLEAKVRIGTVTAVLKDYRPGQDSE